MIFGTFYRNDVKGALKMFGPMSATEIKAKLALRNIRLDETQVLEAINLMLRYKEVRRSDIPGKFVFYNT